MRPERLWVIGASLVWCCCAIALAGQTSSLDYPQWRGRQRDGSASGFVAPAKWPAALTRRWKVEVGEGYATPLVVGDVVYVFTRRDGEEGITAVEASTGRERWRSSYPAPYSCPSLPRRMVRVPRPHRSSTTTSCSRWASAASCRHSTREPARDCGRRIHQQKRRSTAPPCRRSATRDSSSSIRATTVR